MKFWRNNLHTPLTLSDLCYTISKRLVSILVIFFFFLYSSMHFIQIWVLRNCKILIWTADSWIGSLVPVEEDVLKRIDDTIGAWEMFLNWRDLLLLIFLCICNCYCIKSIKCCCCYYESKPTLTISIRLIRGTFVHNNIY